MDLKLTLEILAVIWAVITLVLFVLLMCRRALSMREEDQMFLDKAEEHMAREQQLLVAKILKLGKYILVTAILSGVLLLAIAAVWVYRGLTS